MSPSGERLELPPREVHVWHLPLETPARRVDALFRALPEDERARADRFRFDRDRRRYVVTRSALRTLLGRYLGRPAEVVRIEYTADGKPVLASGHEAESAPLRFNVSHSNEMSLLAFTRAGEIGVDIEHLRPVKDALRLAERFFSEGERADLASVEPDDLDRTFFTCWTRKEAYVKGLGPGIRAGLDRFRVSILHGQPPEMLWIDGDPRPSDRWRLAHVECDDGYIGAVAVEATDWRLVTRRWGG